TTSGGGSRFEESSQKVRAGIPEYFIIIRGRRCREYNNRSRQNASPPCPAATDSLNDLIPWTSGRLPRAGRLIARLSGGLGEGGPRHRRAARRAPLPWLSSRGEAEGRARPDGRAQRRR